MTSEKKPQFRRVYLDNSATTAVRPEVLSAMLPYFTTAYGNAGSVHSWGREAKKAMDGAREEVASLINAKGEEIIFTSGGTESDNLALRGVCGALAKKGNHVITSSVEHHAVLYTLKALEKQGFKVTYLPVDKYGVVDPGAVSAAITPETILISIMHGQNEVGSIQPVEKIGEIAGQKKVLFHVDAVQSAGKVPIDVKGMGIDLLTLSSHKLYGPKGVGALYAKKGVRLTPQSTGGAHEKNLRAGTENVAGIVGFGVAAKLAKEELPFEPARLMRLRDRLIDGILGTVSDTVLNGPKKPRLPHNVNVGIRYIEGEALLLNLDMMGIAASSGSACTSGSLEPSHVLLAMGIPHEEAHGSLRMTLGRDNTEEDIDYVLEVLPPIVGKLRSMSVFGN